MSGTCHWRRARQCSLPADRPRDNSSGGTRKTPAALDRLENVVNPGGNVFAEPIETVEHCTLGQITAQLQQIVGKFRPTV